MGLNIIQVYAPTGDHSDDEVDLFYEQLDNVRSQCRSGEVTIVMGDLNAKVGESCSGNVVGSFGLGDRNARGDKWVGWCESWEQIIMNTCFRYHKRHLYSWKSPGDRVRNQIDYITINKRFRNSISQVKTYPGADCGGGCDHVPVVAEMRVKLKKLKKNSKVRKYWSISRRDEALHNRYAVEVSNRYAILSANEEGVEKDWRMLQDALVGAWQDIIPTEKRRGRKAWITEEILDLMEEGRILRTKSEDLYKGLDNRITQMCIKRKEEWLRDKCQEMEQLERSNSRLMAKKIREVTGKRTTTRSTIIQDKDGDILAERGQVLKRWEEYVRELYGYTRVERPYLGEVTPGPYILKREVEKALGRMKWRKAEGNDGVVVEMVEAAGEFAIEKITELANKVYRTGIIPKRMEESEFIVLPKKKEQQSAVNIEQSAS